MQPRVLHTFFGRVRDTTRLINMAKSAVKLGYPTVAIGAGREGLPPEPAEETVDGVEAVLVPLVIRLRPGELLHKAWQWLRGSISTQTEQMPSSRSQIRTFINVILYNLWLFRIGGRYCPTLIHCHEIMAFPGSWLLARRYRIPVIYDAWEPTYFVAGAGFKHRLMQAYQRWIVRRADVVVITASWLEPIVEENTSKPVVLIGNWKDLSDYDPASYPIEEKRQSLGLDQYRLVVSYIGLLFEHRKIRPLLQAVAQAPDVALLIAGRGPLRDEVIEAATAHDNIIWLDWLSQAEVPLYTLVSDVIYCCVPDTPQFQHFLPNKLFEALVAGRVLLVHANVGEMASIVAEHEAGWLVPTVTPMALQEAFEQLKNQTRLQRLKQNAFALRQKYHWGLAEQRLDELYRRLLNK